MLSPETSDLFTERVDRETGVSSYVLERRDERWSMSFYPLVDPSTRDQRFLWVKLLTPPSPSETLGVIDFERDELVVHEETTKSFLYGDGFVDPETGRLFWPTKRSIYSRRPRGSEVEIVGRVDRSAVGGKQINVIAKVLDRSPDGERLALSLATHDSYHIGHMDVETGDVEIWADFDRHYTYPQFDPDDPDRMMIAQDNYTDPVTNEAVRYDERIWMVERGDDPYPVFGDDTKRNHQIWDPKGEGIWYQRPDCVIRYDLEDGDETFRWNEDVTHFDVSGYEDLIAFDLNADHYQRDNTHVGVHSVAAGESRLIAESMPQPTVWAGRYDPDPHPKFVLNGSYVMYTVPFRGGLDLALTPVDELF